MNDDRNASRRSAPDSLDQMKRAIDQLHQGRSEAVPTRKLQLLMRALRRGRPGQQPDTMLSANSVQGVKVPPPITRRETMS